LGVRLFLLTQHKMINEKFGVGTLLEKTFNYGFIPRGITGNSFRSIPDGMFHPDQNFFNFGIFS